VVLATVVLVAAGCGDDDDDDGSTSAAETTTTEAAADGGDGTTTTAEEASSSVQAVDVTAVDYEFTDAPAELEAGVIDLTFTNDGEVAHEYGVAEIGDTPLDTFLAEFPAVLEGGPFPEYVGAIAVPATVGPGDSLETSFTLTEGTYAVFCTLDGKVPEEGATTTTAAEGEGGPPEEEVGPAHFTLGMAQVLEVTAGDDAASLPEDGGTITARDYGFDVDVEAGDQTVTFVNEGPEQVHHAVMFTFNEGVDEAAASAALDTMLAAGDESSPPPPELDLTAEELGTGVFSAGLGQTIPMTFEAGRTYAAVCFLQDRAGGPPHVVAHGMKEVFTVPS
jgi:plastocyanin